MKEEQKLEHETTVGLDNLVKIVDEWSDIPLAVDLPLSSGVSKTTLDALTGLDARQDEWYSRLRQTVERLAARASNRDSAGVICAES